MPPSRLDGREPASVTRHIYDRRGRLLRSVTEREPEWTERDVAELAALALYRSWLCPCGCGYLAKDTTSHEQGGPSFVARHAATCRARIAEIDARSAAEDGRKPSPYTSARIWSITKSG